MVRFARNPAVLAFVFFIFFAPLFLLFWVLARGSLYSPPRAVWAWNFDQAISLGVDFYKKYGISTVYLYLPTELREKKLAGLGKFLKDASKAGMQVYALGGEPSWALNGQPAVSFVKRVWELNSKLPAKFAGIHLDIEPYLLPEWKKDTKKILYGYLDTLRTAEAEALKNKLRLEVDIPFWFDKGERPLLLNYGGKTAFVSLSME